MARRPKDESQTLPDALPAPPRPYFLITQIHTAMVQTLEQDLAGSEITPAAGRVLNAIAVLPEVSLSEVARLFGIAPQSVKQSITMLENAQLIERNVSESDRRVLKAKLTDKGWAVRQEHLDAISRMYATIFKDLTQREMDTLVRLLTKSVRTARPAAMVYIAEKRTQRPPK